MGTPVRIKDIANDVQLPVSTVGNILRNDLRYDKELRQRVTDSAQRLGYLPNILARGLKGGKTQTVGILFSLGGPHSPIELVRMIAGGVHERQYATQLSDSLCESDVVQDALRDYIRRGVEAAVVQIIPNMPLKKFEGLFRHFRAVVLVPSFPLETTADQVVLSRRQAIYDAVDHLLDTGRRRPMILVPPAPREEKIDPFLSRLRERSCVYQDEPVICHRSHRPATHMAEVAWEALETHCPASVPFDALLCGTDEAAVAACKWLATRGKSVPHDVAVVGFNDSTYSGFLTPALASINRRDEQVAHRVTTMLFGRLENPDLPPQRVDIDMEFVPRESAG
ncbi:MAG: LacI family transcriptional regulator [Phycisphaerae bacterium]|nr:LacI family transcriptional regulator [Phycisphaerae bacterium]